MEHPAGESNDGTLRVDFDRRLRLEFHGSRITSDAGLLAYRELDDALGLTDLSGVTLSDGRRGKNTRHLLTGLLRQSVFGRLAGYEDLNDAERLAHDPAMRAVVDRSGTAAAAAGPMLNHDVRLGPEHTPMETCAQMAPPETGSAEFSLPSPARLAPIRLGDSFELARGQDWSIAYPNEGQISSPSGKCRINDAGDPPGFWEPRLKGCAMPMTEKKPAKIACACNACELTLADGKAVLCVRCGCEDCRQALQWGHQNGGVKPDPLPLVYYMRSDIIDVKGRENMVVVTLREDGRSRRIYCRNCYSILGVHHPNYDDTRFANWPKHCLNRGDLTTPVSSIVGLIDYSDKIGPIPVDDVPVFHTFRYPQELARFRSLEAVANVLTAPAEPVEGITLSALIESLGPPLVLNLERGKGLLS